MTLDNLARDFCDGEHSLYFSLYHGDCGEILPWLEDNSLDSMVTDPPAGISFMGKSWDADKGGRDEWVKWLTSVMRECLRVLKPGAHGLVWAIPRTAHWTATALEDAGFEIRDCITHLFGSGFPKSLDVSKAIDKAAGAERKVIGQKAVSCGTGKDFGKASGNIGKGTVIDVTAPSTPEAEKWQGWGTALKPAVEFWWLVRKPLGEKTVAANVLKHSTGALNIDGCRIAGAFESGWSKSGSKASPNLSMSSANTERAPKPDNPQGRFPANLVLSHSQGCKQVGTKNVKAAGGDIKPTATSQRFKNTHQQAGAQPEWKAHGNGDGTETVEAWECEPDCAVRLLDEQSGTLKSGAWNGEMTGGKSANGHLAGKKARPYFREPDSGGASRFFYCAKASKSDKGADNTHPTVKSTALMRYLIRAITPPNGCVLDPFAGSGSTGVAALREEFYFLGVEREWEYFDLALTRLEDAE